MKNKDWSEIDGNQSEGDDNNQAEEAKEEEVKEKPPTPEKKAKTSTGDFVNSKLYLADRKAVKKQADPS